MRNYLFKGNPGTGKTYLARASAYYLCHENLTIDNVFSKNIAADIDNIEAFVNSPRCEYVQVHASMGYEDIVYGANISASGTLAISYAEKRVKQLCDRANGQDDLYCVIFDDISRANAGALLGNLLYAIEYRKEAVELGDGQELIVPDNVVFIFTECTGIQGEHLDYALRRRMDYVKELYSNASVLERYYADFLTESGRALIIEVFNAICHYIDRTIVSEYRGHEKDFYPGTTYYAIDNIRHKVIYQVFPYIRELQANGIITGEPESFFESIVSKFNTGISGLSRVTSIRKMLANSGTIISPYNLSDTIDYYRSAIIPGGCSDNKGMLESVIDAIILNGVFPHDVALTALLMNTEIAAIPSKAEAGVYASYLIDSNSAPDFYYESARRGRSRAPHQYYSTNSGNIGRWAAVRDVAAYQISFVGQEEPVMFLPLNGLRLHTFTVENVCKVDNPAEIYGALYRLVDYYLRTYATNIALIMGDDSEYNDLHNLIQLEIRYLKELNQDLRTITANTQTEREKARIHHFGRKLLELRTLWNMKDSMIAVDSDRFLALKNGEIAFTTETYEHLFECEPGAAKTIILKGVVKMADLKDYQKIMENIGVRQMIFQGPPGTSKTFESKKFVLRQLAPTAEVFSHTSITQESISNAMSEFKLTEADYGDPTHSSKIATGGWDLVQFHPSYGYEDFIRGIEVKTPNGVPTYNTVNRILGKIAEFARIAETANPENPPKFYLLIDEINRANLATVFGELIYGLEYRNSQVSTPYEVNDQATGVTTKDIVIGKNLFIIGTMNTADKSIDAIDYAIRRRFIFIDSPASREVVVNCYQNISGNTDENSIELMLFDAVQAIFDDTRYFNTDYQRNDVRLGHTYFLRKKAEGYADDIVEHFVFQVVPILKEYVKDGILDSAEELIQAEHTFDAIFAEPDHHEQIRMIADNIMVYTKEFGSMSRFGVIIDNDYIGNFVDKLIEKFGF